MSRCDRIGGSDALGRRRWQVVLPLLSCMTGCVSLGLNKEEIPLEPAQNLPSEGYVWSQLGPDNDLIVRTLTNGGPCPTVTVDGDGFDMTSRDEPSHAFPIRVCETSLPDDAEKVHLGNVHVALPPKEPRKIVVLGDTGCRIKKNSDGFVIQACNDPQKWPFAAVAKAAAAEKPDLIVHLGDYHYRENACPEGESRCAGSAYGDVWGAWSQDFFEPVRPLLAQAPWIFVRGNHELCSRAGNGWFRLFDPRPALESCVDRSAPYVLVLGQHMLAVLDSADDKNTQDGLNQLPAPIDAHLWILGHRPFLTPPQPGEASEAPASLPSHLRGLGKVSVVLAGHRHVMSLNQFRDNRPLELILGNSGTELDPSPKAAEIISSLGGPGFQGTGYFDFGYLTIERAAPSVWTLIEHDRSGKPVVRCEMTEALEHKTVLNCDSHAYDNR
jgi:hypothetical protein